MSIPLVESVDQLIFAVFSLSACQNPVDLGFIVDGSSSVSPSEFNLTSELVSTTVGFFEMSGSSTRVGVMEYSESARVWIRFGLLLVIYLQVRNVLSAMILT